MIVQALIAEFADEHQRRIAYFRNILGAAAIPIPLVRADQPAWILCTVVMDSPTNSLLENRSTELLRNPRCIEEVRLAVHASSHGVTMTTLCRKKSYAVTCAPQRTARAHRPRCVNRSYLLGLKGMLGQTLDVIRPSAEDVPPPGHSVGSALDRNCRASLHCMCSAQLDVGGAFQAFIGKALGQTFTGVVFNPYTHDQLLLIAAFILEDVMVTAYQVLLLCMTGHDT